MVTFGWQQQTVFLLSWQHIVSALVFTCAGQHYWAKLRRDGHWVSDPQRAGPDAAAGGSRHVVRDPAANLPGLVTSSDSGLGCSTVQDRRPAAAAARRADWQTASMHQEWIMRHCD